MRTTAPSPSPSTASRASSPSRASRSEGDAAMASLSVAIVTYRCDAALFQRALRSLAAAVSVARAQGRLGPVRVHVIANGPDDARAPPETALGAWDPASGALELHCGHGNIGYGRANNLVLPR